MRKDMLVKGCISSRIYLVKDVSGQGYICSGNYPPKDVSGKRVRVSVDRQRLLLRDDMKLVPCRYRQLLQVNLTKHHACALGAQDHQGFLGIALQLLDVCAAGELNLESPSTFTAE